MSTALKLASADPKPAKQLTIERIEACILDLPTTRAHRLSNTEIWQQSVVLCRVILSDGSIGYGEGATLGGPRWSEESVESILSCIQFYLAPAIKGQIATQFEQISVALSKAASRNNSAKAAVESAIYDAVGKALDVPASQFLGGRVHDSFEVIWALASGDVDQEIEEARAKLDRREHRRFKVKVGFKSPQEDLARLTRLVEALPGCEFVIDVNQGWTPAKAQRWVPVLADLGVALIEQPLPADDMDGLARVTRRSQVPVMIDEGAFSNADIARAGRIGAGNVLSLKLVKSGGLMHMKRAAAIAQAHGMELYGGCLLESGVGAAAHLAVFSTLSDLHWGTEHFGPRILVADTTMGEIEYRDFKIYCPCGAGLGVSLNNDLIRDCSRTTWGRPS